MSKKIKWAAAALVTIGFACTFAPTEGVVVLVQQVSLVGAAILIGFSQKW